MSPNKTLYIRDEDMPLWERAEKVAKSTRQSVSLVVASALRRHLGVADDIEVRIEPTDPGTVTVDEKPALVYGRHVEHGQGWTLWYQEPGGNGVDDYFIPGNANEAEKALASARRWLRLRKEDEGMEEITVEVGEPAVTVGFTGRWLLEPERDETRTGEAGYDGGAFWGVALTKRGRIAVYTAHCNERWPATLNDYDSLDDAERNGVPADIAAIAAGGLAEERVIWRDI